MSSQGISTIIERMNNPQTGLQAAQDLVGKPAGRSLVTGKFIEDLNEKASTMLAVVLAQTPEGQKILIKDNLGVTKSLLQKDKPIAVTIAATLMHSQGGQTLLSKNEKLRKTLLEANRTKVRNAIRPILHAGNILSSVSKISKQSSQRTR